MHNRRSLPGNTIEQIAQHLGPFVECDKNLARASVFLECALGKEAQLPGVGSV
jgi:hypothetical protein